MAIIVVMLLKGSNLIWWICYNFDEFIKYDVSVKKFQLKPPYFSALMMQSSFIMDVPKIVQRSKSLANDRSISACRDVFVSRNDHTLHSSNKDTFTPNERESEHECETFL